VTAPAPAPATATATTAAPAADKKIADEVKEWLKK
jgi:hypothetical protein